MSILGMGPLEILTVLMIAFILLGPDRMVEAARFMGKMVGEGRRLASEMPRVVVEDDDIKVVSGDETISMTRDRGRQPDESAKDDAADVPDKREDDGPVAFSPASNRTQPDSDPPQSSKGDKIR